jgi:transcriptional regulator with XRE-family HTH domain
VTAADERAFLRALGDCIRVVRLDRGLSQEQLAASAGLSVAFVGQLERGNRAPNVVNLWRVADALRAPLAVLVDEAADASPVLDVASARAGGGG